MDAFGQDILDVLVAFGIPASRNVRVSDFVHEYDVGLAGDDGVKIHFFQGDASVFLTSSGNYLEPFEEPGRF